MNISIRHRSLKEIDYINVVSFSGKSDGRLTSGRLTCLRGKYYSTLNKRIQPRFWFKLNRSIQYFSNVKNVDRIYVVSEKYRKNELPE
jgi:hypothetical protein